MISVIIYNICNSNSHAEELLSMCVNKSYIEKIFFISSLDADFSVPKTDKIDLIKASFADGINTVLFSVYEKILQGYIFVIPDTFLFSEKYLEYIHNESKKDFNKLYILGKENNCIINENNDYNPNERYQIYSIFDEEPAESDYESCLFFSVEIFKRCKSYLEKAVSLKTHYFVRYFSNVCKQNSFNVVYPVNERLNFCGKDIDANINKHDIKIAKKLDIIPVLHLNFFQKIFSLVDFNKRSVLTILGISIPFKIKKKPSFGINSKEFIFHSKRVRFDSNRACIFAGFTAGGKVSDNELLYIKSLRNHIDYLVYVADSLADDSSISKLKKYCDSIIIKRHNEYDFGSYKRGYQLLAKEGLLSNFDSILLCNDSVDFVGDDNDLCDIFEKSKNFDAYSLCKATYGFGDRIKRHKYLWIKSPHLQSYFIIIKRSVFLSDIFSNFLFSVKHHKHKTDIIKLYEMGMSELLRNNNFSMGSFYPYDDSNIVNPYAIYLSKSIAHPIFTKHMLTK